jgi:hypothetical protein
MDIIRPITITDAMLTYSTSRMTIMTNSRWTRPITPAIASW